MAFKVRLFHGSPDYESLHVAKLTCFRSNGGITSPIRRRASALLRMGFICSCSLLRRNRSPKAA